MKALLALLLAPTLLLAQATPTSKQNPPPGIAVPEADAAELKAGLGVLIKDLGPLSPSILRMVGSTTGGRSIPAVPGINTPRWSWVPDGEIVDRVNETRELWVPDVEVFFKAVHYALDYGEFFKPQEIAAAKAQLKLGAERMKEIMTNPGGHMSWLAATGPQVLGYRSTIDGSVQPYGLIVPEDWKPGDKTPRPIYLWFHGRGDTLSEVAFIAGRLKAKRDFAPAGAFELHLYGRWCNASKFAGEVDAFEALADVQRRYAIDPQRIAVLGFSMGGATAWHMGAHHAGLWAVVGPGAGFAETQVYAKVYDPKKAAPPWWEEVLYRLYNATDVAANFTNVPLVVYSGSDDPQKQAADMMEAALAKEGMKMEHLIGPGVGHKYEPETKKVLAKRFEEIVTKGRVVMPPRVRFQTYTLRYNQMKWITLDALERHWERAEIDAELVDEGTFRIKTKNITAFTIALPAGPAPLDKTHPPRVVIDEQELVGPAVKEGWTASFRKTDGKWQAGAATGVAGLTKRHGLQGPIDDAFMDSFIFVRPTGKALNDKVGAWAQSEMERAIVEWRKVFRGDVRVKDDTAITSEDIEQANLVLWGDPGSNKVIAQLLPHLPVQWTRDTLSIGALSGSAADHAPIFIYPNPANPDRYVVINSGFTFRMGAKTSNSLQTPKLPDWALIDLRTPPSDQWPGQVVDAGFFDESWKLPRK